MWQGRPNRDGWVTWKPIVRDPGPFNPYSPYAGPADPTLKAFLSCARLCSPLIRTKALSFYLPNTPTHDPVQGIVQLRTAWDMLWGMRLFPFGLTEDRSHILCLDMNGEGADGHSPVVLVPAEVYRDFRGSGKREVRKPPPLFPSSRALLENCLLQNDYPWIGNERALQRVPAAASGWTPFDWEPLLRPEAAPGELSPAGQLPDPEPSEIDGHLDRLGCKVELLRLADPGCLIPGSDMHQYRWMPALLPTDLADFEKAEGCQLPPVYHRLLMRVGNGGFGCGAGLRRLEDSCSEDFGELVGASDNGKGHLRKRFPHRRAWSPPSPLILDENDPKQVHAYERYHSVMQIAGTVLLNGTFGRGMQAFRPLLLVTNGPERGHIWCDLRGAPVGPGLLETMYMRVKPKQSYPAPGIVPLVRCGPWSLLAWLEGALDYLLAHIDELYLGLPDRRKEEFVAAHCAAFGLDRLPAA
jgi:hypothetical protein